MLFWIILTKWLVVLSWDDSMLQTTQVQYSWITDSNSSTLPSMFNWWQLCALNQVSVQLLTNHQEDHTNLTPARNAGDSCDQWRKSGDQMSNSCHSEWIELVRFFSARWHFSVNHNISIMRTVFAGVGMKHHRLVAENLNAETAADGWQLYTVHPRLTTHITYACLMWFT